MARNNFKLIGKIQLGKETEKFKPYKVSKSAKGWIGHRLSFGLKNITGFHNLELFAGYMEDGTSSSWLCPKCGIPVYKDDNCPLCGIDREKAKAFSPSTITLLFDKAKENRE